MKALLLLITIIIFNTSHAQDKDQLAIVQACIDLPELQERFLQETREKGLLIYDNGVVSNQLKLSKFGKSVSFVLKPDLFFYSRLDYAEFKAFERNGDSTTVTFVYIANIVTKVEAELNKLGESWEFTSIKLTPK